MLFGGKSEEINLIGLLKSKLKFNEVLFIFIGHFGIFSNSFFDHIWHCLDFIPSKYQKNLRKINLKYFII